jgi:hypothetical protein
MAVAGMGSEMSEKSAQSRQGKKLPNLLKGQREDTPKQPSEKKASGELGLAQ